MYAKRRTWRYVRVGSIIQSKEGVCWKVVHDGRGHVGLRTRDGEEKILKRPVETAPVDIMYLTQAEVEKQLRDELGAVLFEKINDGEQIWQCLAFDGNPGTSTMKFHLLHLHGITSLSVNDPGKSHGMTTRKQLIEAHDYDHANPGPRFVPHIHLDKNEEVTW